MRFDEMTDEQVAYAAQKGDATAFATLVSRYESRLLRYAKRLLNSQEDAQDVVQESFIKAYRYLNEFDTSKRFSPWIYRIVHNESINYGKARKSWLSFVDWDELLPLGGGEIVDDMEAIRQKIDMEKMLDALDLKYREVLTLYYIEGMEYADIAEVLHIPIATVGVRLRRARQNIKKIYEAREGK